MNAKLSKGRMLIDSVIAALSPEDSMRLNKMATAERLDPRELAVKILSDGASTPRLLLPFVARESVAKNFYVGVQAPNLNN